MTSETPFSSQSLSFVEKLLEDYSRDPSSVPDDWQHYFRGLGVSGLGVNGSSGHSLPSFPRPRLFGVVGGEAGLGQSAQLQHKVDEMVRTFRVRGHLSAQVNPLADTPFLPELELTAFGISPKEAEQPVISYNLPGPDRTTARALHDRLRDTYCGSIGIELMHITNLQLRDWFFRRLEVSGNRRRLNRADQIRILRRLTAASLFEEFIQKKYLGAKSFSLEGAESLIPLLDLAIEKVASQGVSEIVMGMAHRGRLNVLANILGKSPRDIFREFEDDNPEVMYGSGDVKYHLGHSSDWQAQNDRLVHLSLCFNPSHLEFINPVVLGRVRAKQDRAGDTDRRVGMALLIHGDASFAGEGVIQETLNLSELPAYTVGGTMHVIVNNQIGFTTSPDQGRSNRYASDVAKMVQAPIFHVNGEDPEAVAQVVEVGLEFRHKYQRDVVIDMYCYRRRGHNEGDEPAFTQPGLYKAIRERDSVRAHYLEHLLRLGEVTQEESDKLLEEHQRELDQALESARESSEKGGGEKGDEKGKVQAYEGVWAQYQGGRDADVAEADTAVSAARVKSILGALAVVPEGFSPHPKLERMLETRGQMARGKANLDWSAAEALAFGTLLADGVRVRLTGQDVERGTFSHRHAVLHDHNTDQRFVPLRTVAQDPNLVSIHNSPLSEIGVLGFEYGYSLDCPDGLVVWEAQFGDFYNAAQVVVDQFISSGEDKWNRLSGVVLLLPHGFEGQGPEHSSARLERWLTLCAEDNMQVVYPTTPAQYFHVLRRQVLRPLRKPLIVMSPKSLLRHPDVVSARGDFTEGTFQRVLPDARFGPRSRKAKTVERIILCSGKIFYELEASRKERKLENVAIIRLEQLYPLPSEQLEAVLRPFGDQTDLVWVQEEPRNMGAWSYLRLNFVNLVCKRFPLRGVYRQESASPATGSARSHKVEQSQLLDKAFADL